MNEKLHLIIVTECDDCHESSLIKVDLDQGFQAAIEQIQDNLPCPKCGSLTIHTMIVGLGNGVDFYQITD